jgi:hypothetical protein
MLLIVRATTCVFLNVAVFEALVSFNAWLPNANVAGANVVCASAGKSETNRNNIATIAHQNGFAPYFTSLKLKERREPKRQDQLRLFMLGNSWSRLVHANVGAFSVTFLNCRPGISPGLEGGTKNNKNSAQIYFHAHKQSNLIFGGFFRNPSEDSSGL